MAIRHKGNCYVCNGSGKHPLDSTAKCPRCKGREPCDACKGKGVVDSLSGLGTEICAKCKGKGIKKPPRKCKHCKGTGLDIFGDSCAFCQGSGEHAGTGRKNRPKITNLVVEQEVARSIEVGEFASELIAAVCYRERTGIPEGDWLEDPTRAITDGMCFAEEIRRPTQNTFQVTVSLDVSSSMYPDLPGEQPRAATANPLFYAMHQAMLQSMRELPPGVLIYAPFTFSDASYRTPEAYMKYYKTVKLQSVWGKSVRVAFPPEYADYDARAQARRDEGVSDIPSDLCGGGTRLESLLSAIQKWESQQMVSSNQLTKLDIVITDGGISSNPEAIEEVSRIQRERSAGAKVSTILLNVTGQSYSETFQTTLPEHIREIPIDIKTLNVQVRNVLMDTVEELLA